MRSYKSTLSTIAIMTLILPLSFSQKSRTDKEFVLALMQKIHSVRACLVPADFLENRWVTAFYQGDEEATKKFF